MAQKHNSKPYKDYHEIIGHIDAATIVVPTSKHFEVSESFLENDIDILVEKPICHDIDEAAQMIKIAEDRDRILQVGHLERFNGGVVALKERVIKPMFIESHRIGPFAARGTDVDVILDLMIHDIDIILSLVQSEATHVHANGVPIISNNVDIANARIHFKSGCVANVTASRASMEQVRKIRVFQPHNYLSLNYKEQSLVSFTLKNKETQAFPQISLEHIDVNKSEPLRAELEAFVQSVKTRAKAEVSGFEGREALRVALMVTKEIRAGIKNMGYC